MKNARMLQWLFIATLFLLGTGGYFWYRASAGVTTGKTPVPSEMSASGLVGYWTFDGADYSSATVITDKSGNSHSGTLTNSPTKTTGRWGQALDFPGSNQYVSVGAVYNGVKTVAFWVWADSTTKNIVDLNATATIDVSSGTIRGNNFTSPTIYIDGIVSSTPTIDTTGWHFVAITTGTGINASAVDIGRISTGYFDGRLDDVRMYSSELSASAVYQLYTAGNAKVNAPSEDPLSQSLRGYWKLDDGSGTNATDASGNSNTLSMTGSPSWTTGNIGPYSLDFSGSGQYLSIASPSSALDFADGASFTITGWFNRDTFAADHTILSSKSAQTTSDGYIIWIDNNAGNDYLMFRADENGSTDAYTLTSSTNFSSTGWHHFAVSWNESAPNAVLYIDGNAEGSASGTAFASMGDLSNTNPFSIGAETDGGLPFDGKLDDIRIYGYALSADQVKKICNTTSPTQPVDTSLVGHWTFDGTDMQGTTAIDRSSFGNNGTITGAVPTIGKLGQALQFNGSTDLVDIPTNSSIDQQSKFSFCAWVYATGWGGNSEGVVGFKGYAPAGGKWYAYLLNSGSEASFAGACDAATTSAWSKASNSSFSLNVWTFLCSTYDNTGDRKVRLYKDGTEVSYALQQAAAGTAVTELGESLFIGNEGGNTVSFQGNIDDARLYNRVLTGTEILNLYNVGR